MFKTLLKEERAYLATLASLLERKMAPPPWLQSPRGIWASLSTTQEGTHLVAVPVLRGPTCL